jgi:hypothetical protein
MEPENDPLLPEVPPNRVPVETNPAEIVTLAPEPPKYRGLRWIFIGDGGLRAGWSVAIFAFLLVTFGNAVSFAAKHLHLLGKGNGFTPKSEFIVEFLTFLMILAAAALVALIERRSVLDFNLRGPHRPLHFLSGLVAGFAALSALIGALAWGGWLHFGHITLSGAGILKFGAMWAAAFVLVGFVEEGMFRCYLQFTLTRGINFWWALGIISLICGDLLLRGKGNGIWGVYIIAGLGLIPCALLHLRKTPGSSFWQAAWVTSTLFGFVHTSNNGENWIGIFAAAAIGFVFCVSVWATGSAWWAIGCHAAWDWSETYFYGAADSGNVATGHYLTTTPAGPALWSGGSDGPEGSVLVIAIVLLLLLAILVLYGRGKRAALSPPVAEVTIA